MQKKYAVVTDSACDLPDAILQENGILMVPLHIIYKHVEYRDRVDITPDEVYQRLSEEVPKSSLPLPEDVTRIYDTLIEQGVTDIAHFCISSGLSGTYNMVRMQAEAYQGRLNIRVLDTKALSMEQGFMVLACAKSLAGGTPFDEAVDQAMAIRPRSLGTFVIKTLEYLAKGGRIGLVEGMLGTLLQLKPVIFVNDDGVYQTAAKARGYNNAIDTMLRNVASRFQDKRVNVAVVHGAAEEEGQKLLEKLGTLLNIAERMLVQVSPVLGVHTGPGLVGVIAYEL